MISRAAVKGRSQALGNTFGVSGQVYRRLPLNQCAFLVQSKRYTAHAADGRVWGRNNDNSTLGTVTARSRDNATIDELLEAIGQPRRTFSANASTMVVLFSSAYAQHASDPSTTRKLFSRLCGGVEHENVLDCYTAVVDKVPSPNDVHLTGDLEGFAYLLHDDAAEGDSKTLAKQTTKPLQPLAHKPGFINFLIPNAYELNGGYDIQVPLAQTVFSTGTTSTLIHTRYEPGMLNQVDSGFQQPTSTWLESVSLSLPFTDPARKMGLSTPLVPLTPLREVQHSVGNIIRQISKVPVALNDVGADSQPTSMTASQELEAAVNEYFSATGIPPEPVEVWAMIFTAKKRSMSDVAAQLYNFPAERREGAQQLSGDKSILDVCRQRGEWAEGQLPSFVNPSLYTFLRQGARLRKIFSGGGGWGKKAGLLSLDPDVQYSTRELRRDEDWQFNFNDEDTIQGAARSKNEALGQIAGPNDAVMFFLAPRPHVAPAVHSANARSFGRYDYKHWRSLAFGTVPSTMDDVPLSSTAGGNELRSRTAKTVSHCKNLFGALSERGISVSKPSLQLHAPSGGNIQVFSTKIDVPMSRLRLTQQSQAPANRSKTVLESPQE
ncbi:hypothetical protein K431DRAFT_284357 [Polychaeton citri CBS 116435]|uniref:Uncharacterized protein n=1 Tax=Polychaeton citri CBS 116435 TaxID=1314669 RepID=A0A9P4QBS5_9PEZI|nr:hypothetical protein K431DRAFT_284357 [Polychaeton citri CBS 116435]